MVVQHGTAIAFWIQKIGANDYTVFKALGGANVSFNNVEAGSGDTFPLMLTGDLTLKTYTSLTYVEVIELFDSLTDFKYWWVSETLTDKGIQHWDGADRNAFSSLEAFLVDKHGETIAQLQPNTHIQMSLLAKGSYVSNYTGSAPDVTGDQPVFCQNALVYLNWNSTDGVRVWVQGSTIGGQVLAGAYYVVDSSVTSQALLKTFLESVYEDDNYLFAVNLTTGDICVTWQDRDVGASTFTYSVELEENLTFDDEVSYVITKRKRDMRPWLK